MKEKDEEEETEETGKKKRRSKGRESPPGTQGGPEKEKEDTYERNHESTRM